MNRLKPTRSTAGFLALFVLSAMMYLVTVSRNEVSIDVMSTDLSAWRIAGTGEPWLDAVIDRPDALDWDRLWIDENLDGHVVVYRSSGTVAAAIPAYWVAGANADLSTFSPVPGNGMAALLTALSVTLLAASLRPSVGTRASLIAGTLLAVSTPIWAVAADGMWPHTITILGIGLLAFGASRDRWWLAGVGGGVAFWGRVHTCAITAIVALVTAIRRRQPGIALRVGVVGIGFVVAAAFWSQWLYGTWNPGGAYRPSANIEQAAGRGAAFLPINTLGLLVSPGRGLLTWTPVLLLLLPSVVRGWRGCPDWARSLAVGGVVYLLLQSVANYFAGGDSFYAYRLGLETLVCLFPVYVFSFHSAGRVARTAPGPVVGLQAGAMLLGALPIPADSMQVLTEEAWTHNNLVELADRYPAVWGLLAVAMLIGGLVARIVRQNSSPRTGATTLSEVSPSRRAV